MKKSFKKFRPTLAIAVLSALFFWAFVSPNKILYFLSFFALGGIFYIRTKSISDSLFLSFVFSLFFDNGVAASLFLKEPASFNFGSAWKITPLTLILPFLIIFPRKSKKVKIQKTDILIFLFLIWNFILILKWPFINHIFGLFALTEIGLSYYIFRLYLTPDIRRYFKYIFAGILLFQVFLGFTQFILHGNVGLPLETSVQRFPYGLTSPETPEILRVTGSYYNANTLAYVVVFIIPFIFTLKTKFRPYLLLGAVSLLIITYTRTAWIAAAPIIILSGWRTGLFKSRNFGKLFFAVLVLFLLGITFFSAAILRARTTTTVFGESGSLSNRFKIYNEGFKLLGMSPIFGTGLNMYEIREYETGNELKMDRFTPAKKIHNLFIEVAVQSGIPGLLIFTAALFWGILVYIKGINPAQTNTETLSDTDAAFYSLLGLLLMSFMFPVFLLSDMRLIFCSLAFIIQRKSPKTHDT